MADDEIERWSRWRATVYGLCSRDPRSNRVVVEAAAPGEGDAVVDVGCGVGAAVRRAAAAGADATGVDPSPAMVDIARRRSRGRPGVSFVVGDAADLPLPDDSASIAWTIASFHHWPDRRAGLVEIRRVLRPGGCLLIGERRLRRAGGHGLTPADADSVVDLLRSLGYEDVSIASHRALLSTMQVVSATATGAA
ncbi:MAG TPA: class I SAM-dependent methyltransferase [Euzebyales bacterium]|nr:class I SAM-dependent methyltransferase [Euzebyales bacterium]